MSGPAPNLNALFAVFGGHDELTMAKMIDLSGISDHQTVRTAGKLVSLGFVSRLESGRYVLTEAGLDAKAKGTIIRYGEMIVDRKVTREPDGHTVRQRAWAAMNVYGVFSISELVAVACDDPSRADHLNIQRYCRGLRKACFLLDMPTRAKGSAQTSNGFKRYRMVNYTGEIAPTFRVKKNEVYDHNTGEVVACQI